MKNIQTFYPIRLYVCDYIKNVTLLCIHKLASTPIIIHFMYIDQPGPNQMGCHVINNLNETRNLISVFTQPSKTAISGKVELLKRVYFL